MPLPLKSILDGHRPSRHPRQICSAVGLLILSSACEAQRFGAVDNATTADDAATARDEQTEPNGTSVASSEEPVDLSWAIDASDSFVHDAATENRTDAPNDSPPHGEAGGTGADENHNAADASLETTDLATSEREASSDVPTAGGGWSDPINATGPSTATGEQTEDHTQSSNNVDTSTMGETSFESSVDQGETLDNWPPDLDDVLLDAGLDAAPDASNTQDANDAATSHAASETQRSDGGEAGIIDRDAAAQLQDASLDAQAESDSASNAEFICTPTMTLPGIVRDFSDTHPDMEPCEQQGVDCSSEPGLVEAVLGKDGKPVLADAPRREGSTVSGSESFSQWYRDVEGVNSPTAFDLELRQWNARLIYSSDDPPASSPAGFYGNPPGFFPIDDALDSGYAHNYHFTYEVRSYVEYTGGESLRVRGDDDIWVFIDRKLVVDLGGIHLTEEATVELDDMAESFGLVPGRVYEFHLFFAERHTEQSNLRLGTSLRFMNCSQGQSL